MTALLIVLIVLAVLSVLFLLPIRAVIDFYHNTDENGGEISIRYIFLNLKVFPVEKKIKEEAEKTDEEVKEKAKKEKKKGKKTDYIALAKAVYEPALEGVKRLLQYTAKHAIMFREVNISADFGFSDPAATGMAMGGVSAVIYNLLGFMERNMQLKSWNVNITPDFDEPHIAAGVHLVISTNIFHVLALAGIVLRTFLKIQINIKRS